MAGGTATVRQCAARMGPAEVVASARRAVRGYSHRPEAASMDDGVGDVADATMVATAS